MYKLACHQKACQVKHLQEPPFGIVVTVRDFIKEKISAAAYSHG